MIMVMECWAKMSSVAPWQDSMETDDSPNSNRLIPDTQHFLSQWDSH